MTRKNALIELRSINLLFIVNYKTCYTFLLFLFMSSGSYAQTLANFEHHFRVVAEGKFQEPDVDSLKKMYKFLYGLYTPTKKDSIQKEGKKYPLDDFSKTALYKQQINFLFNDTAWYKSNLACVMAALSHDTSRTPQIIQVLERRKYADIHASFALLSMKSKDLTPLLRSIDSLKKYETVGYLVRAFLNQEPEILEKFASDSVGSRNDVTRQIALQAMAKGKITPAKEKVLKQLILDHDSQQGWAISVLAEMGSPDMLDLVRPNLFSDSDLTWVSFLALANSPTERDARAIDTLLRQDPPIPQLYRALSQSSRTESQKKWLSLLRDKPFPEDYIPILDDRDPILKNDAVYQDICETILFSDNEYISQLFSYFRTRKDEQTTAFLLKCISLPGGKLANKNPIYARLAGRKSEQIRKALPSIMDQQESANGWVLGLLEEYDNFDYVAKVKSWIADPNFDQNLKQGCEAYLSKAAERKL